MFSETLVKERFKTMHAPDDAGTVIARTALFYNKEKQVKIIGEDTDILISMNKDIHEVIFQSESRTWIIQHLVDKTGHMKEAILLIYTFLGCDTVSRIYGIDKDKITKCRKLVNICCDVAPIFYNYFSSKLDIQEAGGKFLLGFYKRVNMGSLNKLRHKIFMEKVAGKSE